MSKVANVILMLQYLQNGRKYTIQELSEKLEVSPRMVRVYKEELEKAGIFVDTIMGPYGGYVLSQNIKIPSRRFTKEDYEFLKILSLASDEAEKLNLIADKIYGAYMDNQTDKIELKKDEKNNYNVLTRAIKEKRKVKINYFSLTDNAKRERIIRPYDLFLYPNGWGCVAFCEFRNHLRSFELKRISDIELLDETF